MLVIKDRSLTLSSLSTAILSLGKTKSRREPNLLTDLGDAMFCQKGLHDSYTMGRHIDSDSLICSLGHYECDGHTVQKLS